MADTALFQIATIMVLSLVAQWSSWYFKLPSILFLLAFGFLAGPLSGLLAPDDLFGDLLMPVVSISVAVILFEGGLSLRFNELSGVRSVVFRLVTVGALITWGIGSFGAFYLLELPVPESILLGAILTVSGPTVVMPLLRHVRLRPPLGAILKWEGILVDPVGAILAVLVFETILTGDLDQTPSHLFIGSLRTLIASSIIGAAGAMLIAFLFRRHLVPHYLQNVFTLSMIAMVFVLTNEVQPEAGLLSVTLMGVILANLKNLSLNHVREFKEVLSLLIISALFILLSARLDLAEIQTLNFTGGALFFVLLVFVARPLGTFASSIGSDLNLKERLLISFVYPRGIVAAAVSSVFALELSQRGHPEATLLAPYTFLIIVGTVVLYGLSLRPLASWLKVAQKDPQGVLFLGANSIARAIASHLKQYGLNVVLIDRNIANVRAARNEGISAHYGDILAEDVVDQVNLDGIGRFLALTASNEANSLGALRFGEVFEPQNTYQLSETRPLNSISSSEQPKHLRGRALFGKNVSYSSLTGLIEAGGEVRSTMLTDAFTLKDFEREHGPDFIPLFLLSGNKKLEVITSGHSLSLKPGQTLISLMKPEEERSGGQGR